MKSERIEKIKSRFKHEWLLIKIDHMDASSTTPVSGHLIAHSPSRDVIYRKSIRAKGIILIDYSDNTLPDMLFEYDFSGGVRGKYAKR